MSPPRPAFRRLAVLSLAMLTAPLGASAQADAASAAEIVAEALFLADTLPAGSNDFNLVLSVERDDEGELVTTPNLQFAAPLGDRMGFTVDLGIPPSGGVEAPGASLKLLLRDAAPAKTGFSASLDVYGSLRREVDTEVAVGLGALRPFGRLALRATALGASGVSGWTPRLHAGISAALALSPRLRALAEVFADLSRDETIWSAGPTLKVALSEHFAVMGGALFEMSRSAAPIVTVQLTSTM